jgi:hypothetical protein
MHFKGEILRGVGTDEKEELIIYQPNASPLC